MQVTGAVSGAVPFLVWETGGIHAGLLGSSGSRKADRFHQAAVAVPARRVGEACCSPSGFLLWPFGRQFTAPCYCHRLFVLALHV